MIYWSLSRLKRSIETLDIGVEKFATREVVD
jgi:hypothetical protein